MVLMVYFFTSLFLLVVFGFASFVTFLVWCASDFENLCLKLFKIFLQISLYSLLAFCICSPISIINGWGIQSGSGSHTGIVNSVDTSGIWFKTNLVYIKSSKYASNANAYCVTNKSVLKDLSLLSQDSERVVVYYHNVFNPGIKICYGSSQIIYKVKLEK